MKHSLQLRLSQHLTLTPQLQQSIRLLQLSTLELNQELERFLQENPLLERDDGIRDEPLVPPELRPSGETEIVATPAADGESLTPEPDPGEIHTLDDLPASGPRDDSDEGDYPQIAAGAPTLRAHLLSQLSLTNLSDRDR